MSPEAPALIAGAERLGFSALQERIALAAGRLAALGLGPGGRVGLWAENGSEWAAIALAAARAGIVLVPLNTRLTDAEIAWQVERSGVLAVVADDALAARRPGPARFVGLDEWRGLAPVATPGPGGTGGDQTIVFTSGTTGRPKGAVLTRASQLASARAVASALAFGPAGRWLASLPFFHVGGLAILHRCALTGACAVLPDSFSAADLDRAIEAEGITHLSLVDATLARLLAARGGHALPETVRAVVVGGGPVTPSLLERCPQALASYGLTEAGSMVTVVRPGASEPERHGAGRPLPGVEVRIADDQAIEVRGPIVMRGYLDDPAATAQALREGWLRTGDLGEIDPEGCLRVFARRDDLIVSGGENVYPAEIELALRAHPGVADAVVVGVPDAKWGEVPLAVVVCREGGAADLEAFLAARLARYKRPRIVRAGGIPRLANGKPDRVAVRARFGGPARD